MLQQLHNRNNTIDIVALSETFLTKNTEKLINIPGYQILCNSQTDHKGGGVCFLLKNGISAKQRKDLESFIKKEIETVYMSCISKTACFPANYAPHSLQVGRNVISGAIRLQTGIVR